jgi:rhamnopyranosyl-N-acetylglucosaminyl-diphospho-decaprenol beta-1,3/1,4-galactofuranosyltransferase
MVAAQDSGPAAKGREGGKLSIAAVVVTCNRKELLRQNLAALEAQTRPLEEIIVVDNGSDDGTAELLAEQRPPVTVIRLRENVGFSAGAARGLQFAVERGHDWIWFMDDDGFPEKDGLEQLCDSLPSAADEKFLLYSCYLDPREHKFCEPVTFLFDGRPVVTTDFEAMRKKGTLLESVGGPFLALFLPRSVMELVGVPRADVFIWGDFEYIERIRRAGFKVYYNTNSILYHPSKPWMEWRTPSGIWNLERPVWRPIRLPIAPLWKHYYGIRNMVDYLVRHAHIPTPLGLLKGLYAGFVFSLMVFSSSKRKSAALRFCYLGFRDGLMGRMGKRLSDQEVRESLRYEK